MLSFTIGKSSISVFIDGEFNSIDESHLNYEPLLAQLKLPSEERDLDAIRSYVTVKRMIEVLSVGRVTVLEDSILYDGNEINNYMTQRMVELLQQGFDIAPWARFMDNVFDNPADYARDELYEWMEKAHMPLTQDGCFLAFKKVRSDYTDCHTGKFDNSPGTVLEMDRGACDPLRTRHCSTGFHFCSADYLSSFGGERVIVVKVNPKNVTSIPNDYSFTKGRCCRYEVIAELTKESAAYDRYWSKGLVKLDDPAEFPPAVVHNIRLPDPVLNEPVQAESDPLSFETRTIVKVRHKGYGHLGQVGEVSYTDENGRIWVLFSNGLKSDFPPEALEETDEEFEKPWIAGGDIEEGMTDAGKASGFPPHASPFPTPEQLEAIKQQGPGRAVQNDFTVRAFSTRDGRAFSEQEIKNALVDATIRAASRHLGIQDSTLRGWMKALGL